jgi:hypothetical protein
MYVQMHKCMCMCMYMCERDKKSRKEKKSKPIYIQTQRSTHASSWSTSYLVVLDGLNKRSDSPGIIHAPFKLNLLTRIDIHAYVITPDDIINPQLDIHWDMTQNPLRQVDTDSTTTFIVFLTWRDNKLNLKATR